MLYQLVYCSRAADGVDDTAVARIVTSSQRHNAERGITGLLVHGSGVFFQELRPGLGCKRFDPMPLPG